MVRALRRIGMTEATPVDPGYEAVEWQRRQVLFPDWTPADPEPHEENVEVYSNAGEVELFLNGKSLGSKATRKDAGALNWKVPYQPGTLKAVARTDGVEVASDVLITARPCTQLNLLSDRGEVTTDFHDVSTVEIQLLDEKQTVVPNAENLITLEISGPGKIIAVDSGSVVSTEPFQARQRKAFQGRAIAIVRATAAGKITLTAKVDGLPPASIELTGR
jgi:beta-galactosidase